MPGAHHSYFIPVPTLYLPLHSPLHSPPPLTPSTQVRGAVGDVIAVMIQNIICLAFGLTIAFVYNWRMALLVLGVLPLMVSGSVIYYNTITGRGGEGRCFVVQSTVSRLGQGWEGRGGEELAHTYGQPRGSSDPTAASHGSTSSCVFHPPLLI